MQIQDCSIGMQVTEKATGKLGAISGVSLNKMEVEVTFPNGMTTKVHPRSLDSALGMEPPTPGTKIPMRPCPQCATRMPTTQTLCPACGYQFSTGSGFLGGLIKWILRLLILGGIGYAVWKFVLHR